MALFTDGQLNAIIDLQRYENRILDVASIEGIDLAGKIALAQNEIADELMMFLLKRWQFTESFWLTQAVNRRATGVHDVVVTKPLRQWHAHKALEFVYRDAYNNQLNDRYQGKWNEYGQLAKNSSQNYFRIGVGIVANPIPRANTPVLSTIAGNGLPSTYYAAVTWVNQAGQEGSASDVAQITTLTGQQLVIDAANPPASAEGWNVYVGETPSQLARQNSLPIEIAGNWIVTGSLSPGIEPSNGQEPNWYVVDHQAIERG
jgi:hypothetical protein